MTVCFPSCNQHLTAYFLQRKCCSFNICARYASSYDEIEVLQPKNQQIFPYCTLLTPMHLSLCWTGFFAMQSLTESRLHVVGWAHCKISFIFASVSRSATRGSLHLFAIATPISTVAMKMMLFILVMSYLHG